MLRGGEPLLPLIALLGGGQGVVPIPHGVGEHGLAGGVVEFLERCGSPSSARASWIFLAWYLLSREPVIRPPFSIRVAL